MNHILNVSPYIQTNQSDEVLSPRIVGGSPCTNEEHPYVVQILTWWWNDLGQLTSSCAGSLVTVRWVLTAAHCISINLIKMNQVTVTGGSVYMVKTWKLSKHSSDYSTVQVRWAQKGKIHKNFKSFENNKDPYVSHISATDERADKIHYDIGLIYVSEKFKQSPVLKLVKLPPEGFTDTVKVGLTAGWGRQTVMSKNKEIKGASSGPDLFETHLSCVILPVITTELCADLHKGDSIDDSLLCTLSISGGKDQCQGDSGSGLFVGNTIVGVVASGVGCGLPEFPGIFTKVENYLDFIRNTSKRAYPNMSSQNKCEFSNVIVMTFCWVLFLLTT